MTAVVIDKVCIWIIKFVIKNWKEKIIEHMLPNEPSLAAWLDDCMGWSSVLLSITPFVSDDCMGWSSVLLSITPFVSDDCIGWSSVLFSITLFVSDDCIGWSSVLFSTTPFKPKYTNRLKIIKRK